MKLIFMGTSSFAIPALQALVHTGFDVKAVFTRAPKPAGRGMRAQDSPVHAYARQANLAVYTPKTLRTPEAQEQIRAIAPDLIIVAAYGLLLPPAVLTAPTYGCINIHGSLLPRWRGAAPIQRAIEAGDAETGITFMLMNAGMDTGPMLEKHPIPIAPHTCSPEVFDRLASIGGTALPRLIKQFTAGLIAPVAQEGHAATHARKLTRDEGHIDWSADATLIERRIRAFNPWPGQHFSIGKTIIKVLEARVIPSMQEESQAAGTVTLSKNRLVIACGKDALSLERLQQQGKQAQSIDVFLRGQRSITSGMRLSSDNPRLTGTSHA